MVSLPGAVENAHSSITLNWARPATNTDGTQLTDLAGYKVYYGASSRSYIAPIVVGNVNTYTSHESCRRVLLFCCDCVRYIR